MEGVRGLQGLPAECLSIVLDYVEDDPDRYIPIDHREFLSKESLKRLPLPPLSEVHDISNFRCVCRRFAEFAIPYQFGHITARFSKAGFRRLDSITASLDSTSAFASSSSSPSKGADGYWQPSVAGCPHLTRHTKKFTYIVPYFFPEDRSLIFGHLERHDPRQLTSRDAMALRRRLEDQDYLVASGEDTISLTRAMTAFTSLLHVKILPVQDTAVRRLQEFLAQRREIQDDGGWDAVQMQWSPACARALQTVGGALLSSASKCNKFSGPFMNLQALVALRSAPSPPFLSFLQQLICLTLQFDTGSVEDLRELLPSFRGVLRETKNLEVVHVGFPHDQPIDFRLEDVFHGNTWPKLRVFGIQAWRLDAAEIIDTVRRHRGTLQGLRLRDVLLKEGSRWDHVLLMLHDEMPLLHWVSLRRIDYSDHFDDRRANAGFEIMDFNEETDSSDTDGDGDFFLSVDQEHDADTWNDDDADSQGPHDPDHSDHGPGAHQLEFPEASNVSQHSHLPLDTVVTGAIAELEDNGTSVIGRQKTKHWEQWVITRRRRP